ncbi:ribbon-helix-helix protein, CopG family [Rhodospirillum sp. A1_3_36]|uniref:ribbon-helix-helix protein, CopG family n=1 Tax=Rhodospirillum sp. A1_3_36 TaxID=3391666 RepID=UPI0039A6638C
MTIPPLPDDLRIRLEVLAEKGGKSVEECVTQAVKEYVENWEEHHRNLDIFIEGEARLILKVVND